MTTLDLTPERLHGDEPIGGRKDDLLGRAGFANSVARQIRAAPAGSGFVLAVTGEWGSGKTSVLRMVEEALAGDVTPLWFNPWMFSSSEELVARFFLELVGQLPREDDRQLNVLAGRLASYGKALAPLLQLAVPGVGTVVQTLAESAEAATGNEGSSTRETRDELIKSLRELNRRIVVFIDDIDRLEASEVREVVRLVKLVGDLPNVVYLLAYDRERVERALGSDAESGRSYLEKIVQVPHTLPPVRHNTILKLGLRELDKAIAGTDVSTFDQAAWSDLVRLGVGPMMRTLRDARRYANVAALAVELVGDEIAGQDVLALVALQVFEPAVHGALPELRSILMGERGFLQQRDSADTEHREHLNAVIEDATHKDAVRETLRLLFPAAGHLLGGSRHEPNQRSWRLERRVASADVFDVYLHASFGEGVVATARIEAIVGALGDVAELERLLSELPDDELEDLLDRLRDYRDRFAGGNSAAASSILGLFPRLKIGSGFGLMPPEWAVAAVLRDLLAALPPDERSGRVERLLDEAPSLAAQWYLLQWFGEFPGRDEDGPRPLDTDQTRRRTQLLRDQVLAASPEALSVEVRLLTLLGLVQRGDAEGNGGVEDHGDAEDPGRTRVREMLEDDGLLIALLTDSVRYSDWPKASPILWARKPFASGWAACRNGGAKKTLSFPKMHCR